MKYFKKSLFLLLGIMHTSGLFAEGVQSKPEWLSPERSIETYPVNDHVRQLLETYTDERKYSEVCWLTTHNAFASGAMGWSYQQQNLDFEEQYQLGVRSFMVDLYLFNPGSITNDEGETIVIEPYIAMCHEPGFLNGQNCLATRLMLKNGRPEPFVTMLHQIKTWLMNDPSAIITLQVESRFGEDGAKEALSNALEEADLTNFLYIPQVEPECITDWPTLGELRNSGRRLVIFSDNVNDGFIHTSAYRETRFDLSRFNQCEMREDNRDIEKVMPLFVLNHFHSLSVRLNGYWRNYGEVNSYKKIMERVRLCEGEHNMLPNFLVMDFVEEGEFGGALQAASNINLLPVERFTHDMIDNPLSQEDLELYGMEMIDNQEIVIP